jgi:Domain of unknown function (DUF4388)
VPTLSQTKFKREELTEVLKYIGTSQAQGRMLLSPDGLGDLHEALIYVDAGRIIAARCGALAGLEAIREVFTWASGSFDFVPEPVTLSSLPKVIWINLALPSLLIEINKATAIVPEFAAAPVPSSHGVLNVNSIPHLVEQNSGMQVQVAPATFQLFPYLNGSCRIGHISQATGMTLNTLQLLLNPLLESGFLELLDFPTAPMPAIKAKQPVPAQPVTKPMPAAFVEDLEHALKQLIGPFGGVLLEDAAENIGSDIDALTSEDTQAWLTALKALVPSERRLDFEADLEILIRTHFD